MGITSFVEATITLNPLRSKAGGFRWIGVCFELVLVLSTFFVQVPIGRLLLMLEGCQALLRLNFATSRAASRLLSRLFIVSRLS
jgi:hypothetical protein